MKRSEMIGLITNSLKENLDLKYTDVSFEAVADFVLRIVETRGMKPPIKKSCPVLLTDTFEWEKEDGNEL